jgi:hypothetical protein
MQHRALTVLWPAFLMAGVLEMLVFAVIDPTDLHGPGGGPLGFSREAVYTVSFLVFWAVIAASGALSAWLSSAPAGAPLGRDGA